MVKHWMVGAAIAAMAVAGCGKPGTDAPATDGKATMKIGVVLDKGGVTDQSFNASAWSGAQRAEKDLGVQAAYAESREDADFARNLRAYAKQNYDLVFAMGYPEQDAYNLVSGEYPETRFVIVDGAAAKTPNAAGVAFREEEGTFLAGALAACMSRTGTIGFVGGMRGPVITRFESGYKAGAKMARPDIRILTQYTGSWDDSGKGRSMAGMQFAQGADIIFHAAGKSGLGVLNAVRDQPEGRYVIGVDSDQDGIVPGRVLTSMIKNVGNAVYDFTRDVQAGKFAPGDHSYGLKEYGVGLSEMKYTGDKVPLEVMEQVMGYRTKIISGEIKPPATEAALKAFLQEHGLSDG